MKKQSLFHTLSALLVLPIIFFSYGCQYLPFKWPEDSLLKLQNDILVSTEKNIIETFGPSAQGYEATLLRELQNTYPYYWQYKKSLNNDQDEIERIHKKVMKSYISKGNYEDVVRFMLKNSPEVDRLKTEYYSFYLDFEKDLRQSLRSKFGDFDSFADKFVNDPNNLLLLLNGLAEDVGERTMAKIQAVEEAKRKRIEEQEEYLNYVCENLLSYSRYNLGSITIQNKSNSTVFFNLAYYFNGTNWAGWTTEGFTLPPGSRKIVDVPLNSSGHLNGTFYYCARRYGNQSWSWGKSDGYSFLTITNQNYVLPMADTKELADRTSSLDYIERNNHFKEHSISGNQTEYVFSITE